MTPTDNRNRDLTGTPLLKRKCVKWCGITIALFREPRGTTRTEGTEEDVVLAPPRTAT